MIERFKFGVTHLMQSDLEKERANNPSYPLQFYCFARTVGPIICGHTVGTLYGRILRDHDGFFFFDELRRLWKLDVNKKGEVVTEDLQFTIFVTTEEYDRVFA